MEIKTELVLDSSQHEMDRNNRMLLLVNAGLFIVIGSIISRLHVLQAWMGVNYEEFAWVLFCFSCGSILSNLIVGRLIPLFGVKRMLMLTMICIIVALISFLEKPAYTTLLGLWMLLSFGFGGSMVVVMSQAGIVQAQQGKSWMSFFQGVSGIGVIGGMGVSLLSNSMLFPIDSHFPLVGLAMLTLFVITIFGYIPYETEQDQEGAKFKLSTPLILLACTNFAVILAISQFLSWSGVMLRDEFQFSDDLATLGSFGFILTETGIRFYGDILSKRFGKIPLLINTGLLTCLFLFSIYLIQHPVWALIGFVCVGLVSGIIQPIVFGLSAEQKGSMARNMAFILLFQSIAFLAGPMITGSIAQNVGLFEIYLFCSCVSALIVLLGFSLGRFQKVQIPKP